MRVTRVASILTYVLSVLLRALRSLNGSQPHWSKSSLPFGCITSYRKFALAPAFPQLNKDLAMKRTATLLVVGCLGLMFAASPCFAQTRSYTVFDVPGAAATVPVSISNSGDVTGWFCLSAWNCGPDQQRGFVRESNGRIAVFDGIPAAINDAGTVAGRFFYSDHDGFLRDRKGNITVFDVPQPFPPAPAGGFALAINNRGDIAGYIIPCPMCDTYQGFVRDRQGEITTFVGSKGFVATGINARGETTGHTAPYWGSAVGFVRDRNGDITEFDVPGAGCLGPHVHAAAINNRGDVAGYFVNAQDCRNSGFVRDRDGSIAVFDATSNATSTTVGSINERGDVVGTFSDLSGGPQHFVRDHKGNITVLDVPANASALSINNRGEVTGFLYEVRDGVFMVHGFVQGTH